jgi:hypothetical protein
LSSPSKKQKMKIASEEENTSMNNLQSSNGLVPVSVKPSQVRLLQQTGASGASTSTAGLELVGLKGKHRPNTSYIYCPEAQQVMALNNTNNNTDTGSYHGFPENIALLIPSSVLNATLASMNGGDNEGSAAGWDSSLLEVTCQVLNLHVWSPVAPSSNSNNHNHHYQPTSQS